MSSTSLIFHDDAAQAMQQACETASQSFAQNSHTMAADVRSTVRDWVEGSESRVSHDQDLSTVTDHADSISNALRAAATSIERLRTLAHDTETKNVAILD
ncbi:MAG: hypothetical protein E6448_07660 [Actinomyces sp.]|nr:hypothetical protein [Actinomyces sp.]